MFIYKFQAYYGRMGTVYGMFVEHPTVVRWFLSKNPTVYFGEILGKYSDVKIRVTSDNLKIYSQDTDLAEKMYKVNDKKNTIIGYNPIEYYKEQNGL